MTMFATTTTEHRRDFATFQKGIDPPAAAKCAQFEAARRDPSRILLLQLPTARAGGRALSIKK